jgi:hypothetical protein
MQYSDWFNTFADWLFNQELVNVVDPDGADSYRRLPFEKGKAVVNAIMKKLVKKNRGLYQHVIDYEFSEDTSRFLFPRSWALVEGYAESTVYRFREIPSATELGATIRKKSNREIINTEGWTKGDKLRFLVVIYPHEVIGDDDNIDIPDDHIELLNLEVYKWVLIQSKQEIPASWQIAYQDAVFDWTNDIGATRESKTIKFKRTPLGR